jgi:ureidoacrylate peracid hydrolase
MHKIAIPQSARDLLKGRLGRERKYPELDPRRTALLAIDMQNAFLQPGMPIELPGGADIIPNINRIAGALRAQGGTVVWIQINWSRERVAWSTWFDHHVSPSTRERMIGALSPGDPGFELHADLETRPVDLFVQKTRFSPFVAGSSELHRILQERGLDTVIITGTVTNTCCEASARDALQLNYKTIFVADGNAARTDAEHNATLVSMLQTFAEVIGTDELVASLERAQS